MRSANCRRRFYVDDGRTALSSNRAERCTKPFTIGRKNWLFANTVRSAQASASYYSVIETAKANGLDPYRHLVWLFTEMPSCSDLTASALESLHAIERSPGNKKTCAFPPSVRA